MSKQSGIRSIIRASACAVPVIFALSAAFAADFPSGSYQAKDLTLVFDGKGQFLVVTGGKTKVSGTYSVQQGQVEVTDVKGPWACTKPGEHKGTYSWTFSGTALTFVKVADSCEYRAKTLVPATWELKQ